MWAAQPIKGACEQGQRPASSLLANSVRRSGVRIHLVVMVVLVLVRGVCVGLGALIGTTVQLTDPTLPRVFLGGFDRLVR